MMSQRLKQFPLLLLIAATMAACTQSQEPLPETNPGVPMTISLSAEVPIDDNDLKAVTFDLAGTSPRTAFTVGQQVSSHAFLRKAGDPSFVGYATITWTCIGRGTTGLVKFEARNATINIEDTNGVTPQPGETWYIAVVLGGGVRQGTKVSFDWSETTDGALAPTELRVPFMTPWTELNTIRESTPAARVVSDALLHFQPRGVLMHVQLTNRTSATVTADRIRLESEATSTRGGFDFSISANPETSLASGSSIGFVHSLSKGEADYVEHRIASIAPGDTGHALVWGMPRDAVAADDLQMGVFYPHMRVLKTAGIPGWMRYFGPVTWSAADVDGKSFSIKGDIVGPALPIEYVLSSSRRIPAGMYNHGDILPTPPQGYTLMGFDVWDYLFPNGGWWLRMDDPSHGQARLTDTYYESVPNYTTTTWQMSSPTIDPIGYGLRFIGNDAMRSAWRYAIEPDASAPNGYNVSVRVRYLGTGDTTPLTTIEQESYWSTVAPNELNIPLPSHPGGLWIGNGAYLLLDNGHMGFLGTMYIGRDGGSSSSNILFYSNY